MKRVVTEVSSDVVDIKDVSDRKVYACIGSENVYKLHKLSPNGWMFCACDNAISGSTGVHSTMTRAIEKELEFAPVYEFDTATEFFQWALENQK